VLTVVEPTYERSLAVPSNSTSYASAGWVVAAQE